MSVVNNTLLLAAEEGGYRIDRSLRFRSSASAYLNRTPGTAGSRTTWTWSGWVKKSDTAIADNTDRILFSAGTLGTIGAQFGYISFSTYSGTAGINNSLRFANGIWGVTGDYDAATTSNYRDPSAWYHVVVAFDSTNGTAANRVKLYINGVLLTNVVGYAGRPTTASLNYATAINNNVAHYVGGFPGASGYNPWDGYMTEINFVDGQALTPSSFGEYNATTGVWQPIEYAGTYGTNGFYLNFRDNASTTTLGDDLSGNGNDWTTNNISLTAGATYDSMIDVPTPYDDGGNGRGNYAVMNPLQTGSYVTQSNGNLTNTGNTATNSALVLASIGQLTSGKWYWEYTQGTVQSETCGVCTQDMSGVSLLDGENIGAYGVGVRAAGTVFGGTVGSITSWTTGDVIGIAVDCDNGAAYWSKNGTWLNSGVPTSGSSKTGAVGTWTPSPTKLITPAFGAYNGGSVSATFGQRPFAYTPPTGFKALNTQNLPESTVVDGGEYFNAVLYTGNAVQDRTITGVGFDPDLVWIKARSNAGSHVLMNRLSGGDKQLFSNLTNAEQTSTDITNGFASDGFILGDNVSGTGSTNQNAYTYVAWNWKANGAGVSNTDGSITSTVSANTTAGFSVVTYTGTGANATVGHGLGVAPAMVIAKTRSLDGENWRVWQQNLTSGTHYLNLNTTGAQASNSTFFTAVPTSTVINVGTDDSTNRNGTTYVAYCFAPVAGYSAFGSYTGNGSSTDGPFVYLGFRPKFLLVKSSSTAQHWIITDTTRNPYNIVDLELYPSLGNAESSDPSYDFLSNGFKLRVTSANKNASGATYIYMAFAENPFKNSLAR